MPLTTCCPSHAKPSSAAFPSRLSHRSRNTKKDVCSGRYLSLPCPVSADGLLLLSLSLNLNLSCFRCLPFVVDGDTTGSRSSLNHRRKNKLRERRLTAVVYMYIIGQRLSVPLVEQDSSRFSPQRKFITQPPLQRWLRARQVNAKDDAVWRDDLFAYEY